MATAVEYIRSSNGQPPPAPSGASELQDWLDEMADMGSNRVSNYSVFENFYRGEDQKTHLTDRTKRFLERSGVKFRENFCETVIDVQAERLIVTGFSHEDPSVAEWCSDLWAHNRMDAKQQVVHSTCLVKGDSFLMLDWDDNKARPCIYFNKPENIKIRYAPGDPDRKLYAVKVWEDDEKCYMNIYYPDRIEKYFKLHSSKGKGGWVQRFDSEDYEEYEPTEDEPTPPWPVPWVDGDGEPLGIPVFHFRNRALGDEYGFSELANVIPEQESLNKQVIDLNEVLDYSAFKQRWATGMSTDEVGKLKTRPGDVWVHPNPDANFGQFESDDPESIVAAIENTVSRLARRSRTPLHLLTGGDMPSGEALRSAEAGLTKKVENCQVPFGNNWEDVFLMAMALSEANGVPVGFEIPEVLTAEWKDPQSRNELELLQSMVLKQQLGVSERTLLMEMGYDADEEQKASEEEANRKLEQQQKMFDGTGGGFPNEDPKKDSPEDDK